jgi:hypothetical protein
MVDVASGAAGMLDLTGKGDFQVPYGVALGKLN